MSGANSRIPVIALSYSERDKAVEKELLVDYTNGRIYVVSSYDKTVIFDLTEKISDYMIENGFTADNLTIHVEGVGDILLGETILRMLDNQISFIDDEETGHFVGNNYQYDLKSITLKDGKVRLYGFDEASPNTFPKKVGDIIRWVPIDSGAGGSGGIGNEIIDLAPNEENQIVLLAETRQRTILTDSSKTYNIVFPTTTADYTELIWNLTIVGPAPTIVFPSNMSWEYNIDSSIYENSTNVITLSSWSSGASWLGRNISYGTDTSQLVTVADLEENYYTKDEITDSITWEEK